MVHRKINYRVILILLMGIVFLFSCKKKESKTPIKVYVTAILAHNNTPVSNIKWKIVETERDGWSSKPTGWVLEGSTDAAGISNIEFFPKKHTDFQYEIYFDYSSMNVPNGNYEIVRGPNPFDMIARNPENTYDIRILPYMDIISSFKNTNCFDSNDTFKFKTFNLDEKPYTRQVDIDGWPWISSSLNSGCIDRTTTVNSLAGHYITTWEATRNNITTTGVDTFYVEPGGNNLIEMFW